MKLRAKIKNKYLKHILEGKKNVEYRQIEGIILTDEDGNEYKFKVSCVRTADCMLSALRKIYPDVPWKDNLPTIEIALGKRIK